MPASTVPRLTVFWLDVALTKLQPCLMPLTLSALVLPRILSRLALAVAPVVALEVALEVEAVAAQEMELVVGQEAEVVVAQEVEAAAALEVVMAV